MFVGLVVQEFGNKLQMNNMQARLQNEDFRQQISFPIIVLDIPNFYIYPKVSFTTKTIFITPERSYRAACLKNQISQI